MSWPACTTCERQVPSLDEIRRLNFGWTEDVEGNSYCGSCSGKRRNGIAIMQETEEPADNPYVHGILRRDVVSFKRNTE